MTVLSGTIPYHISLRELTDWIKEKISTFPQDIYVVAEIAKTSLNRTSGHFYLELVERDDDSVVASMKGVIWKDRYDEISREFLQATGMELKEGIKILMKGNVRYHEVHGLSFDIRWIDPNFTQGDMARKRREIIERLKKEGLIELNKRKPLPPVIQRIAVISSETAAGYGDFLHIIENNPHGYRFTIELFQAYMQGDMAEESIIQALQRCRERFKEFDVVVMIRGGGSQTDIHCFDSYRLGREIGLFPIPVLTGIGHERDETVVDVVSHKKLITPSQVANFIISLNKEFEDRLDSLARAIARQVQTLISHKKEVLSIRTSSLVSLIERFLNNKKTKLENLINSIQTATMISIRSSIVNISEYAIRLRESSKKILMAQENRLNTSANTLKYRSWHIISKQNNLIETWEAKVKILDPINTLKRGYSITMFKEKALKDPNMVQDGDIIETILYSGTIKSRIIEKTKEEAK